MTGRSSIIRAIFPVTQACNSLPSRRRAAPRARQRTSTTSAGTASLSLTKAGRALYEKACDILDTLGDARGSVQQAQGERTGMLRRTCGPESRLIGAGNWIHRYPRHRRQLRAVLADWSLPEVPVHAVFASRRFLTPKVRAFIDLAAEAMGGSEA